MLLCAFRSLQSGLVMRLDLLQVLHAASFRFAIPKIFPFRPVILDHRQSPPPRRSTIWSVISQEWTPTSEIGGPAAAAEVPGTREQVWDRDSSIDRRTRRRLVWRADIRDPVFVLHQADAFESWQRFLRAPGLQHRLRRVELVRLFESGQARCQSGQVPTRIST